MARLIVNDFYLTPSGGAQRAKRYVLWDAATGGARYTDLLDEADVAAGDGEVNDVDYVGGVLATSTLGEVYAQLPDGVNVPAVWAEWDGNPDRALLAARTASGALGGDSPGGDVTTEQLEAVADTATQALGLAETAVQPTALTSAIETEQASNSSTFVTVVVHGSDPNVARPDGAVLVNWIGSVQPNNWTPPDVWDEVVVPDTTAPAVPTGLTATATVGGVSLDWSDNGEGDLARYEYRIGTANPPATAPVSTGLTSAAAITGLPTVAHYAQVRAVDSSENASDWTAVVSATPLAPPSDTEDPTAPTGLVATPGNAQVALSWTASTDNIGVTGYRVYRDTVLIATPSGTSYTATGLTNGTPYDFDVTAVDAAGNESTAASAVDVTPSSGSYNVKTAITWDAGYYADDLALSNGAAVTSWTDFTGNGRTLSQATGTAQPTMSVGAVSLGSENAVKFDGSSDFLQSGVLASFATPRTIVAVFNLDGTSTGQTISDGTTVGGRSQLSRNSSGNAVVNAGTAQQTSTTPLATTAPTIAVIEFNGTSSKVTINGTEHTIGDPGSQSSVGIRLGARYDGAQFLNGKIGFWARIGRVLTAGERADLLAWAQGKYGVA